jgi:hypothetical protein
MKLAIRGFVGKSKLFEDRVDLPIEQLDNLLPKLAEQHALAMVGRPHMIEIEFLDEPNPQERFFRFGTDPSGMVIPVEIDLEKL